MQLLPRAFIARHQAKLLFMVVWLHVSILDFFYVTYSGPTFFWQESVQLTTLAIHLSVALLTLGFYFILMTIFQRVQKSQSALRSLPSSARTNALSQGNTPEAATVEIKNSKSKGT